MTPIRVVVDPYRPVHDYDECPTEDNTRIAGALIAYNVSDGQVSFFGSDSTVLKFFLRACWVLVA